MSPLAELVLVVLGLALAQSQEGDRGDCGIEPKYQCSDQDTARACGVLEQCFSKQAEAEDEAEAVEVTLYYESLCPYCRAFLTSQLWPAFQALPPSVLNLTLVPHGNAQEIKYGGRYLMWCEHGRYECVGNIIASCAIDELEDVNSYFPLIHCMEKAASINWTGVTQSCGKSLNISVDAILKCASSSRGITLQHENAVKTAALDPPHRYVPWITVNGKWTSGNDLLARKDFLSLVCKLYTGTAPDACKKAQAATKTPSIVG